MPNNVTVSCQVEPAHYAVLQALAAGDHKPLSQFIRDTLIRALGIRRPDVTAYQRADYLDAADLARLLRARGNTVYYLLHLSHSTNPGGDPC